MKKVILLLFLIVYLSLTGCTIKSADTETLYQGSTIEALLAGNYDGVKTVEIIKTKGDTGLGTFVGLDGEMIIVDRKVYKASKNGKVTEQQDSVESPFYAVTFFDEDINKSFKSPGIDLESLELELDTMRARNDLPYAIKIKGNFKSIKVRSLGPFEKPYPTLSDAIKEQKIFDYSDLAGTLVGFWLPDYIGNTNAVGYHLHFISDDYLKGGHVLDLVLTDAELSLDETPKLNVEFSDYQTKPL